MAASSKPLPLLAPPSLEGLLRSHVGAILDLQAQRYLGWRWVQKDGVWTKPPYGFDAHGDVRLASITDPSTWLTLEAAWMGWNRRQFDGIGIELLDEPLGLRRVDLDGVRNPATGAICEPALELVDALHSLTTISVSGTGLAIWTIGPPLAGRQATYKVRKPEWPRMCNRNPGIELFNFNSYSCLGLLPITP